MSKCREAFEALYKPPLMKTALGEYYDKEVARAWRYWQAAWNARGKVDAEICKRYDDGRYANAADLCAEALEKEQVQ